MLTARDIAEKIAGPDGELRPAMERVRHWTNEGLLVPLGERNPGTGRKRFYSDDAIVSAQILNILADFGIGLNVMRTALILGEDAAKDIAAKKPPRTVHFLCIYKGGRFGQNPAAVLHQQPDVEIRVGEHIIPWRDHPPMHGAEAALIIDLTRMLS